MSLSCYYNDVICVLCIFFFFKQKTAYEMRISDWSSDVCSSDLFALYLKKRNVTGETTAPVSTPVSARALVEMTAWMAAHRHGDQAPMQVNEAEEIGRASCRERVCQYV